MDWKTILQTMKRLNPYPEDIFTPPTDEEIKKAMLCLRENGFSTERLFGWWGRNVWNFCVEKLRELLVDEEVIEEDE